MSMHRDHNLTHYGLYPLWLSLDLTRPDTNDSRVTPPRSKTPYGQATPELPTPSSGSRREPVKQNSSAWSNVQRSPVQSMTTPKANATTLPLPTTEQETSFREAVEALNEKRSDNGHVGSIGTGRMPYTDKEPQRRMMVVICGEGRDKAAISEVNR